MLVFFSWFVSNSDGFGRENVNVFCRCVAVVLSRHALSAMCGCLVVNGVTKHFLTHTKLQYILLKKTQHNNNDGIMFCRLYCVFCVLIQVTTFFLHFFPLFSHQSPQAVTCFLLRHNWRRQNSLVWEGNKWAWLPSFCSFGDSVSLVRSQQYKCQQVIGPRGDILSPSLVCMRGNNPFPCGLVRPAPRHGSSGFNQTSVLVSEGGLLMEI